MCSTSLIFPASATWIRLPKYFHWSVGRAPDLLIHARHLSARHACGLSTLASLGMDSFCDVRTEWPSDDPSHDSPVDTDERRLVFYSGCVIMPVAAMPRAVEASINLFPKLRKDARSVNCINSFQWAVLTVLGPEISLNGQAFNVHLSPQSTC